MTGATGMLGRSVLKHLNASGNYECLGIGFNRVEPPLRKVNLLNANEITTLFDDVKPNVVVHCAAVRRPDEAAKDPDRTQALNVGTSLQLAKECARVGAVILYISTDYVFDGGIKTGIEPPYSPDSKTMPVNLYGRTKLAGEDAIRSVPAARGVIIRVPILYATDCYDLGESAMLLVAQALLSKGPIKVDNWAMRFPTLVDDVSCVLKFVIDATQRTINPIGNTILHVASPEGATKYEIVKIMAKVVGVDSSHIEANNTPDPGAEPRPRDTQLDCKKTWEELNLAQHKFVSIEKGMALALSKFQNDFKLSTGATSASSS